MAKKTAVDPVTQYARDVRAGREIASRLNRLACERHLNDLDQQEAKGLIWKPEEAIEACDFFPAVLCLPEETDANEDEEASGDVMPQDGTPFILSPHQQFIIGSLFGWFAVHVSKRTGARRVEERFRIAYYEGAKGCGKTPLFAGILILMLIRHGIRGAQLFCAAVTKDQAKLAFADCEKMVQASPALRAMIDQKVNNLAVLETGSFIRPISAEKRGLDGKRVQGAMVDELHEAPSNVVVMKIRAGIKGRPNAKILIPTNSGFDRTSVCWEYHDYSRQVLEGTVVNESWFAFVCHLDACEKCYAAGSLQPSDDCPDCDDWTTEGPHWLKANPNLGVSLRWQYLREQVREAIDLPSQRNMVRRLNFCQWTQGHTIWIPHEKWEACEVKAVSAANRGSACALGFDMSEKLDLTSGVVALRVDDEQGDGDVVELVDTIDGQEVKKTLNLNFCVELIPFFWLPRDTLNERVRNEHIPFDVWEKAKALLVTPGPVIDHDLIYEKVMREIVPAFKPQRIGYDPHNATQFAVALRDKGKQTIVEVKQGRALSESFKLFEALIRLKRIRQAGNPVLGWCVSNAEPKRDRYENMWIEKPSATKRIDGVIAAVIALSQLVLLPAKQKKRRAALVWTPAGMVPAAGVEATP